MPSRTAFPTIWERQDWAREAWQLEGPSPSPCTALHPGNGQRPCRPTRGVLAIQEFCPVPLAPLHGQGLARFAHHRTCRRRLKASAGGVGGFEAVGGVPGGPGPPESGATEPGNADSGRGSRWMAGAGQTASVAPVAARAAGGGRTAAGGVRRAPRVPAARAGRRARARTAPAAGSRTGTRPGSCGR